MTDELAPPCSCSACSEEQKRTEFPSLLLQVRDSNLVPDGTSPPGRSNTKKHLQKGQHAVGQLFQQSQNTAEIPVSSKITQRPRIPSPTDHGPRPSHKWILWCWRWHMSEAIMDEAQHQVPPFHPSAIWNDWTGLLRQTKPHSCWPRQDSFPFQWRELLPASTQNSQWRQQQRPPHSARTPGCHGCCPENYLFIPTLPYPYITCPNPSFAWITMIPSLSHRPLQPSQDTLSSLTLLLTTHRASLQSHFWLELTALIRVVHHYLLFPELHLIVL